MPAKQLKLNEDGYEHWWVKINVRTPNEENGFSFRRFCLYFGSVNRGLNTDMLFHNCLLRSALRSFP